MAYIALLFAGAFLCNAIPHLASGLRGETFPTPFATPRGQGPSSALLNVFWGGFNALVGTLLLSAYPVVPGLNLRFATLVAGALVMGIYLALHFEAVRRGGWSS